MELEIRKHSWYYAGLVSVALLGLIVLVMSSFDRTMQMSVVVLLSFFYVVWGLLHHYMHHDLHAKIVLEYVLMGVLGVSIAFFILG